MVSVEQVLNTYNLINDGDIIGVACSGGKDSMSLLHFLHKKSVENGNFTVVAITIDHGLRETSKADAEFVVNYCNKNNIKVYLYKTTREKLEVKGVTLEHAARDFRYGVFGELLSKKLVTKIALGHHLQDQAETILLNIFRGTGLAGASGMSVIRDGAYIRPLLKTSKVEISAYISANEIPYVEDETNQSNEFARNYIRNMIMPLIRSKWSNADYNICSFGEIARQDDEYIYSTINDDLIIKEDYSTIKIPVSYFVYAEPVVYRIIIRALKRIGVNKDLERKHLAGILDLAKNQDNGSKLNLPNKLRAIKEYNYITFTNANVEPEPVIIPFKIGKVDIPDFGVIEAERIRKNSDIPYDHIIDAKKLPKNAVWRFKQDGDIFTKFGGGTKKLSDYLIDIKVPQRLRKTLPVLAVGNEILIVAGYQISDKLKTDENTKGMIGINAVKFTY